MTDGGEYQMDVIFDSLIILIIFLNPNIEFIINFKRLDHAASKFHEYLNQSGNIKKSFHTL